MLSTTHHQVSLTVAAQIFSTLDYTRFTDGLLAEEDRKTKQTIYMAANAIWHVHIYFKHPFAVT